MYKLKSFVQLCLFKAMKEWSTLPETVKTWVDFQRYKSTVLFASVQFAALSLHINEIILLHITDTSSDFQWISKAIFSNCCSCLFRKYATVHTVLHNTSTVAQVLASFEPQYHKHVNMQQLDGCQIRFFFFLSCITNRKQEETCKKVFRQTDTLCQIIGLCLFLFKPQCSSHWTR